MADRNRWIFRTDPTEYGWDDLLRDGRASWNRATDDRSRERIGAACIGDVVLIAHTRPEPVLVGTARLTADPTPGNGAGRAITVEIEPVRQLARPVRAADLADDPVVADTEIVRGDRTAVEAVTAEQWDRIVARGGTDPGAAADVDATQAGGP